MGCRAGADEMRVLRVWKASSRLSSQTNSTSFRTNSVRGRVISEYPLIHILTVPHSPRNPRTCHRIPIYLVFFRIFLHLYRGYISISRVIQDLCRRYCFLFTLIYLYYRLGISLHHHVLLSYLQECSGLFYIQNSPGLVQIHIPDCSMAGPAQTHLDRMFQSRLGKVLYAIGYSFSWHQAQGKADS